MYLLRSVLFVALKKNAFAKLNYASQFCSFHPPAFYRGFSLFMRFHSNARRTFVIGTSKINIGGLAIPPSPAFLPAVNLEIQLRGKSENMLERNVSHSRNELRD